MLRAELEEMGRGNDLFDILRCVEIYVGGGTCADPRKTPGSGGTLRRAVQMACEIEHDCFDYGSLIAR